MNTVVTEHPNAALVRRGYAAFNKADMETLTELFHEDSRWHTPGRSPLGGSYQGRDAVFGHAAGTSASPPAPSRQTFRRW